MKAAELRKARRELGLNQTEMALRLRVSRSGYVKWERGERRIFGLLVTAVELLLERDRKFMKNIGKPSRLVSPESR